MKKAHEESKEEEIYTKEISVFNKNKDCKKLVKSKIYRKTTK